MSSSFSPPTCYRPDGSAADPRYSACRLGGTSMCCRTNDTRASFPDICRPDGLCQETQQTDIVWRESCTDRTWQAPGCLQLCIDGSDRSSDAMLTFCANGSICCGRRNDPCCQAGRGVFVVDGRVVNASPVATTSGGSSTSTSATTTASTSTSTSATATDPPSTGAQASSASLSTGGAIGIGVAVGAVAIGVCIVAVLFILRRRRNSGPGTTPELQGSASDGPTGEATVAAKYQSEPQGPPVFEVAAPERARSPVELHGTEWKGGR